MGRELTSTSRPTADLLSVPANVWKLEESQGPFLARLRLSCQIARRAQPVLATRSVGMRDAT